MKTVQKRTWSRLALAPVMALALIAGAACQSEGTEPPAEGPPPSDQNQINALPRDQVQDGGTLTWAIFQMPVNFNINQVDGPDTANDAILGALMPSVHKNDATANPYYPPAYLAEEPTLETAPKQKVTYKINPNAVWSDGNPITWEDFAAQWKALNGTDEAYQVASTTGYDQIESVTMGADEREVIVTFRENYADWTALFTGYLYPKSVNSDPAVFNAGWLDQPHITAGPFKLESIDKTAQTVTVVRNDAWWGEKPKLDKIVYRAMEPDAQIDAFANGEIDFIDIGPDVNKYQRAQGVADSEIRRAGGPNFRHFTINGTSPILADIKLRQAVAKGIDRQAIANALLGPLGESPKPLNNHIFMTNQAGYQENNAVVAYDSAQAAADLDTLGWTREGDGVRTKDGQEMVIRFVIPANVATSRQEAELTQAQLADIGVKIELETVPVQGFFSDFIIPGNYDFTVFSWIGTAYPISSSSSIYAEPKEDANGELQIQQNFARVGSAEIDSLFDQANAELDRPKAIELANQADALIWEQVHSLTLYQRPELIACKTGLANLGAFGFASTVYENIGWAAS